MKKENNSKIFLFIILTLIKIFQCLPKSQSDNQIKNFTINNKISPKENRNLDISYQNIHNNLYECFIIINDTTMLKSDFFYSNDFTKGLCQKYAISQKYKEDIYFPKYLHKCFPLCNSCSSFSKNNSKMNCISCLKGFNLENGNCYIDKKYNENKRKNELQTIFNTLNLNKKLNSNNIRKEYINGNIYYFKEKNIQNKKRKLAFENDYDDYSNPIIDREDQTTLTYDKTNCQYNFHIELSPYYILAGICISKGKFYIENNRCVDSCSPSLETIFGYPEVKITVGPSDRVTVCDCGFRCCVKYSNKLYKSLDRGYSDCTYPYFRRKDGKCLIYAGNSYYTINRTDTYLLAQDFVPCFFPIYDDSGEIEFYISGYGKTIVGNNCKDKCPTYDPNKNFYYDNANGRCYLCPEHCEKCDGIPTEENGQCIQCSSDYNILYKGRCYDICPLFLGEEYGTCRECLSSEINIEGKCVQYNGDSYNYGTESNPSFKDPSIANYFHKCVEFIGRKTYIKRSNEENSLCNGVACPDKYYDNYDGFCYQCPEGCKECLMGSKLKCFSCEEGYTLKIGQCESIICSFYTYINGAKKCYADKCPENYYYFEADDNSNGYQCFDSCINSGQRYYITTHGTCVASCSGDESSLISEDYLCLDECNDNYPENMDGVCENCARHDEYNHNGACVVKDELFDEIYYILSGEENEKFNKVGSCYIIDSLGDYHPEHVLSRRYDSSLCPNDCPTGFTKYVENGEIVCRKCYKTCGTCEHTGIKGNHKCTTCKSGYELSNQLYGVCNKICKSNEYYYYNNLKERICTDECPSERPYYSESGIEGDYSIECISSCEVYNQILIFNTTSCVYQCPEGYYLYNHLCMKECPSDLGTIEDSNICYNCTEQSLFYYKGKCYDSGNILDGTYILQVDIISMNPIPGQNNDGILHECLELQEDGTYKTGFYEEINKCKKECPDNYYYNSDEKLCSICSDECSYCDADNCLIDRCPEGYYLALTDGYGKCVSFCPIDTPIRDIDDFCNFICGEDDDTQNKIIIKGGDEYGYDNYKCIVESCKQHNLFFNPLDRVCYRPENIPVNTYYNPFIQTDDENELSECLIQVSESEYTTGFFYSLSNCPVKCPEYFYYAGNNKCKKCHPLCKTCFAEGSNRENNCLSCADSENRILNPYLYNCEEKCDNSFHYSNQTKKIICDLDCPKEKYIDEETGECISTCNKFINNNFCVNRCPEGKKEFNKYCLENIAIPSIIIEKIITIPIETVKDNNNTNSSIIESTKQDEEKHKEIEENNKNVENKKEIVEIIKEMENNFNQTINNNDNIERTKYGNISICQIYMNESKINCGTSKNTLELNECEEKIKTTYFFDSTFYLIQMDLNEQAESENKKSISNQAKYKIYRPNGEEIDISEICKDTKIKIEKEINLNNTENKEEIMKLLEEGVNVFDINDPFFNDICYPYQDENGNDIPLKNRKEDFYQNTVVCIKGCDYMGINPNTSKAMCNCQADSLLLDTKGDDDSIIGYFDGDGVSNLVVKIASSDTIEVVKCYKRTFKPDNIKKNKGFWIYLGFLLLFLGLLAGLLCYGYNSLNSYLFQFAKEKEVQNEEEVETEEKIVTKKVIVSSSSNNISEENENNEYSNPPKRVKDNNDETISVEKAKTRSEKIKFGFDKDNLKNYQNLSITNFGKGYKLSNHYDIESLDYFETPSKLLAKRQNSQETKTNITTENNSPTSSIHDYKISTNHKFSCSKVELEPEGALLAASNFFDTCRIVKKPKNFIDEEEQYYEENKSNNNYNSKINKKMKKRNSLNISAFYQPNKKVVNLSGFPDPQFEKEIYSDEEEKYRKNKSHSPSYISPYSNKRRKSRSRNKNKDRDNPLNRHSKNSFSSNELEDIDENIEDSSFDDSEKSRNNKNKKQSKISYENESIYTKDSRNKNNRYINKNSTKKNLSKYYNSYIQTTEDNLARQPITINKYYINNNTNEDYNIKKKKLKFPKIETINSEEKGLNKQNESKNKNKNNKSNSKKFNKEIITVTTTKKKSEKINQMYKDGIINSELDTADFEEVMLNDHRSFCGIFCSFLSNFQIYISICFSDNIFVPWIMRAAICLFTIELFFTFTALMMKMSQFEKRYKSKKDIDILYLIKYEFSNIMYTTLITKLMNFVAIYIFVHYPITKVIRDYAYKGEIFIREIKKALYRLKCKYYIFMIIFIVLTLAQGYFISCFCEIYAGSVKEWIYSSLIAFIFNLILSFVFIFLAAIFRSMSICCQSWLLFAISNFFLSFA